MDANVQVFRTDETCRNALADDPRTCKKRYETVAIHDNGKRYNLDLMEAIELGFLLDLAEIVASARSTARSPAAATSVRTSRRAMTSTSFRTRWPTAPCDLTRQGLEGTTIRMGTKPVVITRYEPKERTF